MSSDLKDENIDISIYHSNSQILDEDKSEDEKNAKKEEKEESYSSFIIKMLEKPYNYKKINKNNIPPKINNKNLVKKKLNLNTIETNYTHRINNNILTRTSRIINKKFPIKIKDKDNSKKKGILTDEGFNEKKKRLSSLNSNNNLTNYDKTKTFQINSYNSKNNRNNHISNIKKNIKPIKNKSLKDKGTSILNKLYGYNKKYLFSHNKILQKKNLIDIDNYQNNILKVSQKKLSRNNLIKLYSELQTIKINAEMIKPLPPINYPALVMHSFKEVENKKKYGTKKFKDMDEYEKELYEIKQSNTFKKGKVLRNKRIYKIYEILPDYIVDSVFLKKKNVLNK